MVPELPPAPAARVLVGRVLATLVLWSAAARRRRAAFGPPGGELACASALVVDEEAAGLDGVSAVGGGEESGEAWVEGLVGGAGAGEARDRAMGEGGAQGDGSAMHGARGHGSSPCRREVLTHASKAAKGASGRAKKMSCRGCRESRGWISMERDRCGGVKLKWQQSSRNRIMCGAKLTIGPIPEGLAQLKKSTVVTFGGCSRIATHRSDHWPGRIISETRWNSSSRSVLSDVERKHRERKYRR
jgi:hypothetical protein